MKINKIKWALLFLLLFGMLGYFREFVFVHYNNVMYQVYFHTDSHLQTPFWMQFLFTIPYNKLYYFKYPMTLLFLFIFFAMNYSAVIKIGTLKTNGKLVIYAYLVMCIIAGLSMMYAFFISKKLADDEYTLSRWLLGVAQSPFICLFLLASEKLNLKSSNHE